MLSILADACSIVAAPSSYEISANQPQLSSSRSQITSNSTSMPILDSQRNRKMTESASNADNIVSIITPNDIICDGYFGSDEYPGNARLNSIAIANHESYMEASIKTKLMMVKSLVDTFKQSSPPARFLCSRSDAEDHEWVDVSNDRKIPLKIVSRALKRHQGGCGCASNRCSSPNNSLFQAVMIGTGRTISSDRSQCFTLQDGAVDRFFMPPKKRARHSPVSQPSGERLKGKYESAPCIIDCDFASIFTEKQEHHVPKRPSHRRVNMNFVTANAQEFDSSSKKMSSVEKRRADDINYVDNSDDEVIKVTTGDILCGRGAAINDHLGNRRFRALVALYREKYDRAKSGEKGEISQLIVETLRHCDPPGRFLKREDETGLWCDIGSKQAQEKTSQAFREITAKEKRESQLTRQNMECGVNQCADLPLSHCHIPQSRQ